MANENQINWFKTSTQKPDEGRKIIGFSRQWVDEDFNTDGTREAFYNEGECISSYWNNSQDVWDTDYESKPTHWMYMPSCPVMDADIEFASDADNKDKYSPTQKQ